MNPINPRSNPLQAESAHAGSSPMKEADKSHVSAFEEAVSQTNVNPGGNPQGQLSLLEMQAAMALKTGNMTEYDNLLKQITQLEQQQGGPGQGPIQPDQPIPGSGILPPE